MTASALFAILPSAPKSSAIGNQDFFSSLDTFIPLPIPIFPLRQDPNTHPPLPPPYIPNLLKLSIRSLRNPTVIIDESRFVPLLVGVNTNAEFAIDGQIVV